MKMALIALASLVAPLAAVPIGAEAYSCSSTPVGQANPSAEVEPMQPIWCAGSLAAEPTTRTVDQWGGWQDSFQTNVQMGHLNNGDMGYRVFNGLSSGGGGVESDHFVNNNHWMVDMTHDNGGAALSPSQAFHFQNGKLVIEADVAAGIPGYRSSDGDIVWPEVTWSTAAAPTGHVVDGLYLYGQFGGSWASGCRLNSGRNLICALESDHTIPTNDDKAPCFSQGDTRVFELSGFEYCGATHTGFDVNFGSPSSAWRECQANQMDMYCRDRFRFEWSQSGFVAYVNGVKFAEDSGWPGYAQIPSSIVNGSTPVYAYFGEWGDFSDSNVYRFHWGRIAVNPHDSSGAIVGASAAPSFCPSDPQETCPMGAMQDGSSSTSGMPAASPMPSMSPAPAPTSTPSPQGTTHTTTNRHGGHNNGRRFSGGMFGIARPPTLEAAVDAGRQPVFWALFLVLLAGAVGVGAVIRWWVRASGSSRS